MGLKILCAGGSKEEKDAVEAAVRAGIGTRPAGESWMVSLVKIGPQWSVTLDGPQKTSPRATFMAPQGGLKAAISESMARHGAPGGALARAASSAPSGAAGTAGTAGTSIGTAVARPTGSASRPGERRNSYTCGQCSKGFVVSYEAEANEAEETVPAACPHCWSILNVKVGLSASVNDDYRVEKV
jgi:DNA-directed RNA polymerase subunit RPC12/RpoP